MHQPITKARQRGYHVPSAGKTRTDAAAAPQSLAACWTRF
jgi:hypothetical protein